MLWIYGHYNFFNSVSARVDFRRKNLTSNVGLRDVRANTYTVDLVIFAYLDFREFVIIRLIMKSRIQFR